MEVLIKNGNFRQKLKFLSKMEILVKNVNFDQKWKFSSKMKSLFKKLYFRPAIFGQKFCNIIYNKKYGKLARQNYIKNALWEISG